MAQYVTLLKPKGPRTLHKKLQKSSIFHTHYNIFSQLQQFFQQLVVYMSNVYDNDFSRRIFDVLCVVCKGL